MESLVELVESAPSASSSAGSGSEGQEAKEERISEQQQQALQVRLPSSEVSPSFLQSRLPSFIAKGLRILWSVAYSVLPSCFPRISVSRIVSSCLCCHPRQAVLRSAEFATGIARLWEDQAARDQDFLQFACAPTAQACFDSVPCISWDWCSPLLFVAVI